VHLYNSAYSAVRSIYVLAEEEETVMNKRKKRQIIVLLLLLVICIGGYLGIRAYNKHAEEQKKAAEEKVRLCNLEQIESVTINNRQGEFSFQLKENAWVYLQDPDFQVDQNKFKSFISDLDYLTAERSFQPSESLSSYGFDSPSCSLTATDKEGKTFTLLVGDKAEGGSTKNYYAMEKDGKLVHTISSTFVKYLQYSLYDLAELETFPSLSEENITSIRLVSQDKTIVVEKDDSTQNAVEEESAENSDQESKEKAVKYVLSVMKEGKTIKKLTITPEAASNDDKTSPEGLLSNLLQRLSWLSFEKSIEYKPDQQALAEYGIIEPAIILTVNYLDEKDDKSVNAAFTLTIGSSNQEGDAYYAVKDNSLMVNLISSRTVNVLSDMLNAF